MEYESYKQNLETLADGINESVDEWTKLSDGVLGMLETACAGQAIDVAALQDVKASFAAEAGFLKILPQRIEEYRKEIRGLRKFYAPEPVEVAPIFTAEEPVKTGWFGRKKSVSEPVAVPEPQPKVTPHQDQRAFNDARSLMTALDKRLEAVKAIIIELAEDCDEAAYGYKSEVVSLNSEIRAGGPDLKKKEARRFFLEEAVAMLAERSTQLLLHARVVGRLHSSEYMENPFEE
jgi:hypothetical protein